MPTQSPSVTRHVAAVQVEKNKRHLFLIEVIKNKRRCQKTEISVFYTYLWRNLKNNKTN